MKGVGFANVGLGTGNKNERRRTLFGTATMCVAVFLLLLSVLGSSGIATAAKVVHESRDGDKGRSSLELTLGTMSLEISKNAIGYALTFRQAGAAHRLLVADDSGEYRYSIDGRPWLGIPIADSVLGSRVGQSNSGFYGQDLDHHFRAKYWWDGVRFIRGYPTAYPHPERDYYHVPAKGDWRFWGIDLLHFQIGRDNAGLVANFGPYAIGGVIGAVVGALVGGVLGATVGTVVGAIVGGILAHYFNVVYVDEAGAIWWWINKSLFTAIRNIPWWLWFCGRCVDSYIAANVDFLRVGSYTFNNQLGVRGP